MVAADIYIWQWRFTFFVTILEIHFAAEWNVTLTLLLSFNHCSNMKHVSRGFLEALGADVTLLWNAFRGENKLKWSRKWQRWGDSNYEWQRNTFAAYLGLPMLRPDILCAPQWNLATPLELTSHYLTAFKRLSQVLSKQIQFSHKCSF